MDGEGNAIKGAQVSVRGIRHNITTGDKTSHGFSLLFSSDYVGLISLTDRVGCILRDKNWEKTEFHQFSLICFETSSVFLLPIVLLSFTATHLVFLLFFLIKLIAVFLLID